MFNVCLLVLVFITNIYTCAGTHAETRTHTQRHAYSCIPGGQQISQKHNCEAKSVFFLPIYLSFMLVLETKLK